MEKLEEGFTDTEHTDHNTDIAQTGSHIRDTEGKTVKSGNGVCTHYGQHKADEGSEDSLPDRFASKTTHQHKAH